MSKELIAKNEFGKCELDDEFNWLFITYIGVSNVKLGTEILEKALDVIKEKKCPGYVVDLSAVRGAYTTANDYILNEWMPQAIENGCKYNGVIISADVFTRFSSSIIEQKVHGMIMKMFEKMEDAIGWIKSVSQPVNRV